MRKGGHFAQFVSCNSVNPLFLSVIPFVVCVSRCKYIYGDLRLLVLLPTTADCGVPEDCSALCRNCDTSAFSFASEAVSMYIMWPAGYCAV